MTKGSTFFGKDDGSEVFRPEYEKKEVIKDDEVTEDTCKPEEDVEMCERCDEQEYTDEYNDMHVCGDCFAELDEGDDDDSGDYGDEFRPIDITTLLTGLIVLGIVLSVGITVLSQVGKAFNDSAVSNTTAEMVSATEVFIPFGGIMAVMLIILTGVLVIVMARSLTNTS